MTKLKEFIILIIAIGVVVGLNAVFPRKAAKAKSINKSCTKMVVHPIKAQ